MSNLPCQNLTELLLYVIRKKPGMYLGKNEIGRLPNFITGYQFALAITNLEEDFYFGDNGFLDWFTTKYSPQESSFWTDYFLEYTSNNQTKALEFYFEKLEEFYNSYNTQPDNSSQIDCT